MKKIKIYRQLIATMLAITSIASMSLVSPASADYTNFFNLTKGKGFKNIYSILRSPETTSLLSNDNILNKLKSFKNDINFNNIGTSSDFIEELNEYLIKNNIELRYKNIIMSYVKESIIPAFSKPGKFDKDVALDFLVDYISIRPRLDEAIFVSALRYNYVMDAQFKKAIDKYKEDGNSNFNEDVGDTLDNLNLTIKSPNGQSINLNQLNLTKNDMRHILVGDKKRDNIFKKNKGLPVGHTKYAKEGMKMLSNIRYNQLKDIMNKSNSLVNLFTKAVGFSPDAYVASSKDHNDDQYYSITYNPLNDSNYTIKGMFPDSWEWKDIKTDLKNTITANNCIYITTSKGKDTAYFYDLTKNKSVLVIVNLTDKKFVTAIPESLQDLKTSISNDFKGILSGKALRSISSFRISKQNLEKLIDKNLLSKATKEQNSTLDWQYDGDFVNIIKQI